MYAGPMYTGGWGRWKFGVASRRVYASHIADTKVRDRIVLRYQGYLSGMKREERYASDLRFFSIAKAGNVISF